MSIQMLRIKEVMAKTGLCKAMIYAKQNPEDSRYDASFPKGVKMSANTTAWVESEIEAWLENRLKHHRRQNFGSHTTQAKRQKKP